MALGSALGEYPDSLDSSIRYHGQLDMCEGPILDLGGILVLLIRPSLAGLHNLLPCLGRRRGLSAVVPCDRVHLDLLREVAPEVSRVDDKTLYKCWCTKADNSPVDMVLPTGALRLPAIAHVLAPARQDEVVLGTKVLVAARHGDAAVLGGSEVEDRVPVIGEDGDGVAEEPEAGDAAVRVHVEADVRVALRSGPGQLPGKALRGPALLHAEDGLPAAARALPGEHLGVIGAEAALNRDERRVVAREVGRVDLDAVDGARGDAQPDDDPIEGLRVVPARLPAVVPGARVHHLARLADGWRGREEVGGLCEPLVREAEDLPAEGGRDEIYFRGQPSVLRWSEVVNAELQPRHVVSRPSRHLLSYLCWKSGMSGRCRPRPHLWPRRCRAYTGFHLPCLPCRLST